MRPVVPVVRVVPVVQVMPVVPVARAVGVGVGFPVVVMIPVVRRFRVALSSHVPIISAGGCLKKRHLRGGPGIARPRSRSPKAPPAVRLRSPHTSE